MAVDSSARHSLSFFQSEQRSRKHSSDLVSLDDVRYSHWSLVGEKQLKMSPFCAGCRRAQVERPRARPLAYVKIVNLPRIIRLSYCTPVSTRVHRIVVKARSTQLLYCEHNCIDYRLKSVLRNVYIHEDE